MVVFAEQQLVVVVVVALDHPRAPLAATLVAATGIDIERERDRQTYTHALYVIRLISI